jgi:hypothetical protein
MDYSGKGNTVSDRPQTTVDAAGLERCKKCGYAISTVKSCGWPLGCYFASPPPAKVSHRVIDGVVINGPES